MKTAFFVPLCLSTAFACGGSDSSDLTQPSGKAEAGTYVGTFTTTTPTVAKSAPSPASIAVSTEGGDAQKLSWSATGLVCQLRAVGGLIVADQTCALSLGSSSAVVSTTGGNVGAKGTTLEVVVQWRVTSTTGNVTGVKVGDSTQFDFRGNR